MTTIIKHGAGLFTVWCGACGSERVCTSGESRCCVCHGVLPVDALPGNTSEEWRHDRALGAALGVEDVGPDALPTIISWQYLEGMGHLR